MLAKIQRFLLKARFHFKKHLHFHVPDALIGSILLPTALLNPLAGMFFMIFGDRFLRDIFEHPTPFPLLPVHYRWERYFNVFIRFYNNLTPRKKRILNALMLSIMAAFSINMVFTSSFLVSNPYIRLSLIFMGGVVGYFLGPKYRAALLPMLHHHELVHNFRYSVDFETNNNQSVVHELEQNQNATSPIIDIEEKLCLAVTLGFENAVKKLIELKANVNYVKDDGSSILSHAVLNGCIFEGTEFYEKYSRIITLLVENGARVNQRVENGTPLHIAAEMGGRKTVKTLLELGANVAITNEAGEAALTSRLNDPQWRKILVKHYNYLLDLLSPKTPSLKELASQAVKNNIPHPALAEKNLVEELPPELFTYYQGTANREKVRQERENKKQEGKMMKQYYDQELRPSEVELAQWRARSSV